MELHSCIISDSSFLRNIFMGDEILVYGCDTKLNVDLQMESTQFSCEKKNVRQDPKSRWTNGITWAEFYPEILQGTLNIMRVYYLRNDLCRKWPEEWTNDFILHHAYVHVIHWFWHSRFFPSKNTTVCPYPPFWSHLALDSWLFSELKIVYVLNVLREPHQGN